MATEININNDEQMAYPLVVSRIKVTHEMVVISMTVQAIFHYNTPKSLNKRINLIGDSSNTHNIKG